MVTVSFDIDAHDHEGRWFNEINAWGIMEYINTTQRAANMQAAQAANGQQQADPFPPQVDAQGNSVNDGEKGDGLPF
jgi:hypothetical protein